MSAQRIAAEFIERFELDLSGLTVLTEAASGPYLHTPLTAALAGAERVLALTRDSTYGAAEDVVAETRRAADEWALGDRVEVGTERRPEWFAAADLVTNSGFVRPIDAEAIASMKPTAVIPLMWETWEFRDKDMDLDACRERGILVMGTNETEPPCDMRPYSGDLAEKLLAEELGITEGVRLALLGGNAALGVPIHERLVERGFEVTWFANEPGAHPYAELGAHMRESARDYEVVLVAEHEDPRGLLGPEGEIVPAELATLNPDLKIGVISGNVDADALDASGLLYRPERIQPFGIETYETHRLGPRPVLELYAAGLKVGEAMARARLDGAEPGEAARLALASSPAMDFERELAWT